MSNMITFTTPACPECSKTSEFTLDAEEVRRWQAGEFIQDVWPQMPPNQRETLISGTHPKCWDKMFPEDEND
jgi:hypothetical protein